MSKAVSKTQKNWLEDCLHSISSARVTVFGDFCLDAYWLIDPDVSELSVETGLPVHRVRQQRYSLGGAGNIVANLVALGVGQVRAVGLLGADLFGRVMLDMLGDLDVNCQGMLSAQRDWQTLVYAKPYIDDAEQNRIDFGGFNVPSLQSIDSLVRELDRAADESDVVILNQQVPSGVSSVEVIGRINELVLEHKRTKFIVDSRHRAEHYRGCLLKLNAHEAARLVGRPRPLDEPIPAEQARDLAELLRDRSRQTVFITRGENGLIVADKGGVNEVPGIEVLEQTDPVGAGDTTVSAIAAALAAKQDPLRAAKLANIAASVTVRKLKTTGTASPEEILRVGHEPDYVYLPELAEDPRQARYVEGGEIELVRALPEGVAIRHAIFDHDGTISTLRQGWEAIMEPMMVRAILGKKFATADEGVYRKVVEAVRRYIDKTTGIQTLVQMQGLVEMVKRMGYVPPEEVLDIHGYKELYNRDLLAMVQTRMAKLSRRELSAEDFAIKNARSLLESLHRAGVKLYLASGTDQADVAAEAESMGYAGLFEGRVFGAVGDVKVEAKRIVLERIFREHKLSGPEVATFGDGPVEMRETRRRGGIAVGVASDEIRRFGLNLAKRTRLIRAGADLLVPDFSQLDRLLKLLKM